MARRRLLIYVGMIAILYGCGARGVSPTAIPKAPLAPASDTPLPSPTPTTATTTTPTPTIPPTPSATTTPSPTPTPSGPALMDTPPARPVEAITAENAAHLVEMARWGKGTINQVTFSTDGTQLAVTSSLGIYVYDAKTLDVRLFIETDSSALSVVFSSDGALLASGHRNGEVCVWQADGTLLHTFVGHTSSVPDVDFSADGTMVASASYDRTARVWQLATGRVLWVFEGDEDTYTMNSVAFSPDASAVAVGAVSHSLVGVIQLWNVADGKQLQSLEGLEGRVLSIDFSPDGTLLAAASQQWQVFMWRVGDGELRLELSGRDAAFAAAGDGLCVVSTEGVDLYGIPDGSVLALHKLSEELTGVAALDLTPNCRVLASGSALGQVALRQVSDGSLLRATGGFAYRIVHVALSLDNRVLVAQSEVGDTYLWGMDEGNLQFSVEGYYSDAWVGAISRDTQLMAEVNEGKVSIRRMDDGTVVATLVGDVARPMTMAFSPDGSVLAVSSGSTLLGSGVVRLYSATTGALLLSVNGGAGPTQSLLFSQDSQVLVSVGGWQDPAVRSWRVSDGAQLQTYGDPTQQNRRIALSWDGGILAMSGDDTTNLWQVSDASAGGSLDTPRAVSLAFSPDGALLASGTGSGDVELRRISDGALLVTQKGHTWAVTSLAFSSDAMWLISGSYDGTVRLWGIEGGR